MDSISRLVVIINTFIATMLISSTEGTTITAVPGDNKVIQWTMDPVPQNNVVVSVLHPSGDPMFSALGITTFPAVTDLGKRVSNTGNTNTDTGHIEFTMNGITVEDAGDYITRYSAAGSSLVNNVGATLVVYAKPSTPSITEDSAPVESDDMTLRCVRQSNSKPDNHESLQMTYIWYRNGADLPSDVRYVTSGSQLEVKNIQRTDRDTVFTCKAYETVSLTSDVSAGYTVVVQYGPKVTNISPSDSSYTRVEETIDSLTPITCTADCYPGCSFQWFRDGQVVRTSAVLALTGITRSDRGTYLCRVYNDYGGMNSTSFDLSVEYGPKVTNISPSDRSYTRVEVTSDSLGPITCTANCYPGCSFQWFRDGQVVRTSAVLTLTGITRSDRGTYLCRAYNDHGGKNSTSFDLSVEYGPDPITLSPPAVLYVKLEDVSLNEITCTSSCNPQCGYSWERDRNQVSSGQVLRRINNIKRGQAGQFVCIVTNKHGNREASVTVIVQYAPDKPVLSINRNTADIRENSPISFQCTTQSVPPSTMKIYRENLTTLTTTANTISIAHTIPKAHCLDTGLFYCSAENIVGKSTSEGRNANVLCRPRPDHRVALIPKQALGSGESMDIHGTLISNPPPIIYWSFRLDGLAMPKNLTNNSDNFVFYNIQKSFIISPRAVRTDMRKNDFGEYVMHAYNDYGQSTMSFTVTPIGTETDFKKVGDEFTDNQQDKITRLGPVIDIGTVYSFTITARNVQGTAQAMSYLSCSINNDNVNSPESQKYGDIYRSSVAMLVIGLIALFMAIILVMWWRFRQMRSGTNTDDADKKSHDYDSIGQSTGNGQMEMAVSPDGVYEGLGERSMPSIYEGLNHNRTRPVPREDDYINTKIN